MYKSRHVAVAAALIFGVGTLRGAWEVIVLGFAAATFALYLILAIEEKLIRAPSLYSQLALFMMGASVVASAYGSIRSVISEAAADEPNLVLVIAGFMVLPMIALYGAAMTCCSIASKATSHKMIMYFATGRRRMNQKIF